MFIFRTGTPDTDKDPLGASVEQTGISLSPAWTRLFFICGALLEVVSTLLPWGVGWLYLPWSLIIGGGSQLWGYEFVVVSVLIRAAAIVGWTGVVVYEYIKSRVLPYIALLASSILSFLAVVLFASTGISLSWGAYVILVGGIFMAVGVVVEKLEVEIVVEREEKRERDEG